MSRAWALGGLLGTFCGSMALAQPHSDMDMDVAAMFPRPDKLQWVRQYKGRADDVNDIAIVLGYDGRRLLGKLLYLRSHEGFLLDGGLERDSIWLDEIDEMGLPSGYLSGHLRGDSLEVIWQNHDGSIWADFALRQSQQDVTLPSYCGESQWFRKCEGLLLREPAVLYLKRQSQQRLSGRLLLPAKGQYWQVRGQAEGQTLRFQLFAPDGQMAGNFEGAWQGLRSLSGWYSPSEGGRYSCLFEVAEDMTAGCSEYAGYIGAYDVSYPKSRDLGLNAYLDGITKQWTLEAKAHLDSTLRQMGFPDPESRYTERASAWYDVDYISERYVSGHLVYQNTWQDGQQEQSFIYDRSEGRVIGLDELLDCDAGCHEFLLAYARQKAQALPLYRQAGFARWLDQAGFTQYTLGELGLSLGTPYSTIYGRQQVWVPHDVIKPYLRKGRAWTGNGQQ